MHRGKLQARELCPATTVGDVNFHGLIIIGPKTGGAGTPVDESPVNFWRSMWNFFRPYHHNRFLQEAFSELAG